MEKYHVVTAVMEAFDRAQRAEEELARRNREFGFVEERNAGFTSLDLTALRIGKNQIVKDSLDYWHEVKVSRDDETEVVSVEPYDRWAKRVCEKIPDEFSKKDFFEYFDQEIRSKYEEEKAAAIKKFNEKEEE